jgi:hypothetical protein
MMDKHYVFVTDGVTTRIFIFDSHKEAHFFQVVVNLNIDIPNGMSPEEIYDLLHTEECNSEE